MRSNVLKTTRYYLKNAKLNYHWADIIVISLICSVALLYWLGSKGMHINYAACEAQTLSLNWHQLPYYTLRTSIRLLIGMGWSLLFAFVAGSFAAKNKHAERVILPFINFMESVPLVGFLTISTTAFMAIYPNNLMGLECAAIFGVFTGQAWNMALTLYQTMRVVPKELLDAANCFQISQWQQFWKIEVPYSTPGLLWNMMVSQAAAWFAIVGSEAIGYKHSTTYLPGIGSYIQIAINTSNYSAIIEAVIAIILNIIILDQLVFRPLLKWSEKFKFERIRSSRENTSWFYNIIVKAEGIKKTSSLLHRIFLYIKFHYGQLIKLVQLKIHVPRYKKIKYYLQKTSLITWYVLLIGSCTYGSYLLILYLPGFNIQHMLWLMTLTTLRVACAMLLSLILFVPLGIWIGLNTTLTRLFQPIIQILASLPPNIIYPLMAILLIYFHEDLGWWSIPMIMLGTQWYILFNVIAGISTLPQDMLDLSKNYHVSGIVYWRKVLIPAIFPYIVTGIISAAGGAWNADITAEVIQWGNTTLETTGLGAFISKTTDANVIPQEALGCILMCFLVALCVAFIWRPLYRLAETKFNIC